MSLYLGADAYRHLTANHEALLAPLSYEDLEAWMLDVNHHPRHLLRADHAVTFCWNERGTDYFSDDTDTALLTHQGALSGIRRCRVCHLRTSRRPSSRELLRRALASLPPLEPTWGQYRPVPR